MSISRRKFLAGSGASALGIAGISHTAALQGATPEGATPVPAQWDDEVDVVVVGSGAAGITAAITAHDAGANVLMLEKAKNPGGTSVLAYAMGIPNNPRMQERGIEDPKDDFIRFAVRISFPSLYDAELENYGVSEANYALIESYYDNASPTFDLLERLGALNTMIAPSLGYSDQLDISDPDYHANIPENKAPYGRG